MKGNSLDDFSLSLNDNKNAAVKEKSTAPQANQNIVEEQRKKELIRQLTKHLETEGLPEETIREYTAQKGTALLELPEEKIRAQRLMGILVLHEQMQDVEKEPDAAAASAEKLLFLSGKLSERWEAAEDLIVAASQKGLTQITEKTKKRTLKGLCGQLPDMLDRVRGRITDLPEVGSRGVQIVSLLVMVAAVLAALQVFVNPTVSGWFTDEGVKSIMLAVGAIVVIAVLFLAGLGASAITLVGLALLCFVVDSLFSLAAFGKVFVVLVLVIIAVLALCSVLGQKDLLKRELVQRRASELSAIRAEVKLCRRYVDQLARQTAEFLREDKAKQETRDEEAREHHHEVHVYMEQYRSQILSAMRALEDSVPSA